MWVLKIEDSLCRPYSGTTDLFVGTSATIMDGPLWENNWLNVLQPLNNRPWKTSAVSVKMFEPRLLLDNVPGGNKRFLCNFNSMWFNNRVVFVAAYHKSVAL